MIAPHGNVSRQTSPLRREFYEHAVIYLIVNAGLCALDLFTGDKLWFYWVLGGWGIGLAAHAWRVFGSGDDQKPRSGSTPSSSSQQNPPTAV